MPQLYEIVYKSFWEGDRTDKKEHLLSSGHQMPRQSNPYVQVGTGGPARSTKYHKDEIVKIDIIWSSMESNLSRELIERYPDVRWEQWFDELSSGESISKVLKEVR